MPFFLEALSLVAPLLHTIEGIFARQAFSGENDSPVPPVLSPLINSTEGQFIKIRQVMSSVWSFFGR